MSTWSELVTKAQKIAGDISDSTLVQLKDDMNIGAKRFNAALNDYFTRRSKATDLVADQQYYQLPPDCVRVMGVDYLDSNGSRYPLEQIRSEYQWRQLNTTTQSSNRLVYFFIKGFDEISTFPTPSESVSSGLIIAYVPKAGNMSAEDYSTGSVAVVQDSTTVTGTGTTFTSSMVGRTFRLTGESDPYDYKIASYTSGTVISLEEPMVGLSVSGASYLIGDAPNVPVEFQDCIVDFALGRFFEMNNNPQRSTYHMDKFKQAVAEAKENYASSSASMVITDDMNYGYSFWQDNTFSVSE